MYAPEATGRRSLLLSGLMVAAACVALVLLAANGRGDATPAKQPPAVRAVLQGVEQRDDTLGSPHAPDVLVMYVEADCAGCERLYWGVLPAVVDRFVRSGRLRVIARPVSAPGAPRAGVRETYAAGMQDRMYEYLLTYDLLKLQGAGPMDVARAVRGIDTAKLRRDARSASVSVSLTKAEGRAREIKASPPAVYFDPAGRGSADVRRIGLGEPASVVVAKLERLLTS